MIKKVIKIVVFFFTVYSIELYANIENKIVLKVENEIITNFEIKNKILSLLMISGQNITQDNINKYKKDVLNLLIDNKLKKIEVSKYNIKKNENKVNTYLNTISSDPLTLKKKFSENNLDFQLYLNDCLRAGLVYRREFYNDSELEPENSLMFKITLIPFGNLNSPTFSK